MVQALILLLISVLRGIGLHVEVRYSGQER